MHNILIFCSIILATPFIMFGLYKYITWIDKAVNECEEDSSMAFLMKAMIIPAPIIFVEFGVVMYAMIRDYGWGFLLVPIAFLIALGVIHWFTKDWEI
jgi:hypothetical protein